ncbi:hypothetical protein [Jiangella alkaliphila]|nr:hypothetical protein [Jiangella alkaliphila]
MPDAGDVRHPHPLNPAGRRTNGPVWVTTPTLAYAMQLGYEPAIVEAYTWPQHSTDLGPVLRPAAEGPRRAEHARPDDQAVQNQLKEIANKTFGWMGSPLLAGRPGFAPERRHHVMANADANLLRMIVKIGTATDRWPLAVIDDTIVYAFETADFAAAWPGDRGKWGRGFGQFKPEGAALMSDHVRYFTGAGYEGKGHLIDPADWEASRG